MKTPKAERPARKPAIDKVIRKPIGGKVKAPAVDAPTRMPIRDHM